MKPFPPAALVFGGDYNPEQWPESTWTEDVELMREAGVTLVTLGVFSWAWLEPTEGEYDFDWLDRVIDLLHGAGISVDLATATASPPPWFSRAYPDSLPETADGRTMWPGSRQAYCPSSPDYRRAATALVERIAQRYGEHPAVVLWHVNNEYGCHVSHCYCDRSAVEFRRWLRDRYGSLDRLNEAWGTAFWSQRYGDWEEVLPPRLTPSFGNPTQALDFDRFSSDELLACYRAERDVLLRHSPDVPVTTNLMVAKFKGLDYWSWAPELDVVSNDHYLRGEDPLGHVDLALAADLTRSLAGGDPWLLMESSTSAVNWQPRNIAKVPGQLRRNTFAHVARGSEGAMFFQWRASAAGAEKFHAGMVPHAGTDSRVWREVCLLGADLGRVAEIRGSVVQPDVALLWDWQSWWAVEQQAHPTGDLDYIEQVRSYHAALWRLGLTTDLARPSADLSRYRFVAVPSLYLVSDASAENLGSFVAGGGTLLVGPFSGIVDESLRIRLGGYPGAFRDLLGVRVEEFSPLPASGSVRLSDGKVGRIWSEHAHLTGAESLASYSSGPLAGSPALTRRSVGDGQAWYLGTCLDDASLQALLREVTTVAGCRPPVPAHDGVEVVRRDGAEASYLFVLNHTADPAVVPARGRELLGEADVDGALTVPPGGVAVVREHR